MKKFCIVFLSLSFLSASAQLYSDGATIHVSDNAIVSVRGMSLDFDRGASTYFGVNSEVYSDINITNTNNSELENYGSVFCQANAGFFNEDTALISNFGSITIDNFVFLNLDNSNVFNDGDITITTFAFFNETLSVVTNTGTISARTEFANNDFSIVQNQGNIQVGAGIFRNSTFSDFTNEGRIRANEFINDEAIFDNKAYVEVLDSIWNINNGSYIGDNDTIAWVSSNQSQIRFNSSFSANQIGTFIMGMAGPGPRTVLDTLIVNNNLLLNQGILETSIASPSAIILDSTCFVTPAINSGSYVRGPLHIFTPSILGKDSLFFPIGEAGGVYAPFRLNNIQKSPGAQSLIKVETLPGNTGTVVPGNGLVNGSRTWEFSISQSESFQGANVGLFMRPNDLPPGISLDTLLVAQRIGTGTNYTSLGSSISAALPTLPAFTYVESAFVSDSAADFFSVGYGGNAKAKVSAYLEGAFNGTDMNILIYGDLVNRFSNSGIYNPDRMYPGYEVPTGAVDRITLYLTNNGARSGIQDSAYAWLMNDGSVRDFYTGSKDYAFFPNIVDYSVDYSVIVSHRNHLDIMSSNTLKATFEENPAAGENYLDLTNTSEIYGAGFQINGASTALMTAGNAERNVTPDQVNALDLFFTRQELVPLPTGYLQADLNLDGATDANDANIAFRANSNLFFSTVPN